MREIPLTQGKVALVDDEDYEALMKWKWCCAKDGRTYYAMRTETLLDGKRNNVRMHRIILNPPPGYNTDHTNRNGLDNRKENLRVATQAQNQYNRGKQKNNTSGFKGICWHKFSKKWRAYTKLKAKQIHLGYFNDKSKAVAAYNKMVTKLHGEFAVLNKGVIK